MDDADDLSVAAGWAAITPIHYELTNFAALERLRQEFSTNPSF